MVVANDKTDSRERLLLVINRITSKRKEYQNHFRNPTRKNIIFLLRTIEKRTDGLNCNAAWLGV